MAKHVFILGAGASVPAGAPIMWNFLDVADDLRRNPALPISHGDFALVFRGVHALKRAHSNSVLNVDNLEDVFSAFEAAKLFGGPMGDMSPEDVAKLPDALRTLIAETLEETMSFEISHSETLGPSVYNDFVRTVARLRHKRERVALLTFNYDLGLDFAVDAFGKLSGENGILYSYHLNSSDSGPDTLPLLKLHGSLNWRATEMVGQITPNREVRLRVNRTGDERVNTYWQPGGNQVRIRSRFAIPSEGTFPVIVPPTWSKMSHYQGIRNVWKVAASELRDAENIFVCGYSLPPTDTFFHMLFALATTGETRIRRFCVIDPDPSGVVEKRFKDMLGPAVLPRFIPIKAKFQQLSALVSDLLKERSQVVL